MNPDAGEWKPSANAASWTPTTNTNGHPPPPPLPFILLMFVLLCCLVLSSLVFTCLVSSSLLYFVLFGFGNCLSFLVYLFVFRKEIEQKQDSKGRGRGSGGKWNLGCRHLFSRLSACLTGIGVNVLPLSLLVLLLFLPKRFVVSALSSCLALWLSCLDSSCVVFYGLTPSYLGVVPFLSSLSVLSCLAMTGVSLSWFVFCCLLLCGVVLCCRLVVSSIVLSCGCLVLCFVLSCGCLVLYYLVLGILVVVFSCLGLSCPE